MSDRDRTRSRRRLQAEDIVNSLNSKNIKESLPLIKKIKKTNKRNYQHKKNTQNRFQNYMNREGEIKRVQFVLKSNLAQSEKISITNSEEKKELNLSEMLSKKYHDLIKNQTIDENFYSKLVFDKINKTIILCNDNKEDFLELHKSQKFQNKDNVFDNNFDFQISEDLVNEFNLKTLYGN